MRCAAALRSLARSALALDGFERCRSSAIAVFADQLVDRLVFAKFLYARREDDQLRAVGQRHARAIDGLVAQPGAVKLMRIEIDDGLLDRLVEHLEVHLEAQLGGPVKALDVIADEEAAHAKPSVRRRPTTVST